MKVTENKSGKLQNRRGVVFPMCALDLARLHCGTNHSVLCKTGMQKTSLALSARPDVHIYTGGVVFVNVDSTYNYLTIFDSIHLALLLICKKELTFSVLHLL